MQNFHVQTKPILGFVPIRNAILVAALGPNTREFTLKLVITADEDTIYSAMIGHQTPSSSSSSEATLNPLAPGQRVAGAATASILN